MLSPKGDHLLNLLRPFGTPLPPVPQPEGAVIAARDRTAYISNALRGRLDTDWLMYIDYPVIVDEKVKYVLSVTMNYRYWSQWLRDHVPTGMIAGIVDRNFVFLARTHEAERLAGQPVQPWYRELLESKSLGTARGPGVLNPDVIVAFHASEVAGWRVNVLTSGTYVDAPMMRTAALLAAGVLIAFLIAASLALWRARVIAGGIKGLEAALEGLKGPQPAIPEVNSSIREIAAAVQTAKETAQVLEERGNRLRELDRRKDEFLATLAHELRGPLAPIRNAAEILRLRGSTDPAALSAQEIIARQVRHMSRLVDDLLDVSRVTRGETQLRRQPVDIATAVEGALEATRPLFDKAGVQLIVELPPVLPKVHADPTRVVQMLTNLLGNAAKFTPSGGHVWLSCSAAAGTLEIRVRDDGIGLDPRHLGGVFEMFSQVPASGPRSPSDGLGIGLALVKGLAEAHGGTVEAQSEGPGKGSTFILRLPAMLDDARTDATPADAVPAARGPRRRILVADDLHDTAESLAAVLRLQGHEVFTAFNGKEALEAAERYRTDVVVMDIGMPEMNGYEVAQRIRETAWGRNVLLIALSGWGQERDRDRAIAAGFDVHLTKPADPAAIESVMAERKA